MSYIFKHDHDRPAKNVILAVFQDAASAQRVLADSPLDFTVEPLQATPPNSSLETLDLLQPPREDPDQPNGRSMQPEQADDDFTRAGQSFHVTADLSTDDIVGRVQRHPFYWAFSPNKRSFSQEALEAQVPAYGLSALSTNAPPIIQRIRRRNLKQLSTKPTLRQMWEQGREDERNSAT